MFSLTTTVLGMEFFVFNYNFYKSSDVIFIKIRHKKNGAFLFKSALSANIVSAQGVSLRQTIILSHAKNLISEYL